jgi:hypothetical protein
VSDNPHEQFGREDNLKPPRLAKAGVVFNPGAGRLPTPQALAEYAAIDSSYPQSMMASFQLELKRNYQYQVVALVAGWTFALSLAVEAGFLALHGHEKMALALIGANAVGLATRMLTKAASRK